MKHVEPKVRKAKSLRAMCPQVEAISEVYYESLSCPRALTAAILLRYGEYAQIASLRALPNDYASPDSFWAAACASDWLRKYPGLPGFDDRLREEAAKKSWYQSEEECGKTNERLESPTEELSILIDTASMWFEELIGPFPCDLAPFFGPGATVSDRADAVTVLDKVSSLPTMTSSMSPLLDIWRGTAWERSHMASVNDNESRVYPPSVVEGNVFFCVPKDAFTDRGCAKGPSINVAYQLGAGKAIKRNLNDRHGYDLRAKQSQHRELARKGSLDGSLATVDSSRASDCKSTKLVSLLAKRVPLWYTLLSMLREEATFIDDKWVKLNKFSAMGNGFTFELETIVFLSLALAIATARGEDAYQLMREGSISVYGDDVILPTGMASEYINLLSACGFTVNVRKSYSSGNFRESCGGDFFNGVGVNTPKIEKVDLQVADWFSLHNLVWNRVAVRYPRWTIEGSRLRRVIAVIKDQLPRRYRSMYGPAWLGDKVLHGWYGPQIRAKARTIGWLHGPIRPGETHRITDGNQVVGTLEVLEPKLKFADIDMYSSSAQLAYLLYSFRSAAPARRPTKRLEYRVVNFEGDYNVLFEDKVPGLPWWLTQSPFARYFGIESL